MRNLRNYIEVSRSVKLSPHRVKIPFAESRDYSTNIELPPREAAANSKLTLKQYENSSSSKKKHVNLVKVDPNESMTKSVCTDVSCKDRIVTSTLQPLSGL